MLFFLLSVNLKLYLSKQVVNYMLPFLRPVRPVSGTSYINGFVSFASYGPLSLLIICSIFLMDGLWADDFLCHHLEHVFQMTPPLINPTGIPVSIQWLQDLFFYRFRCHFFVLTTVVVTPVLRYPATISCSDETVVAVVIGGCQMQSVYGNHSGEFPSLGHVRQRDTVPVYLSKPRRNPLQLLLQYDWHYAIWARRFIWRSCL